MLGADDVVGGEGYYVEGFEINNIENSIDIIGDGVYSSNNAMVIGQLEFGNSNEVKIVMLGFNKTYIPMYTDMRKRINNELFLGNWYDDTGICYSFGSDYKITHDGLEEIYEPFCYSIGADFNFIELLDTDGETINKVYGYTITDDTLSFYETMEVDHDSVLCPKPFLVLTRKSK